MCKPSSAPSNPPVSSSSRKMARAGREAQEGNLTMTGEQVRAARALLKWPQNRLAADLGLSQSEIASFEVGKSQLSVLQTTVLKRAFEAAGIEFDRKGGVRMLE